MSPTKVTGLRLPDDVMGWLREQGALEERSPAFLVTRIVREEMARNTPAKSAAKAKGKPKR
jgi:hypothetical protein